MQQACEPSAKENAVFSALGAFSLSGAPSVPGIETRPLATL